MTLGDVTGISRYGRSRMTRISRPLLALAIAGALAAGQSGAVPSAVAAPPVASAAPGAPGAMSHFGLARKDCVGTARNTSSKVWFTVAGGVLSDVYYPTIDNTNIETLQYIVTDGSTFTDLQTRDTTYTVKSLDDSGMSCRITSTAKNGKYTIVTDYLTDPRRNSVAMETTLKPARGVRNLKIYVRMDATVNGNGGGGDPVDQNAGADHAVIDTSTGSPVPVSIDIETSTIAANRDYAAPVYAALRADRPFRAASSGYVGTGERRPRATRHRSASERRRTRPPPTATSSRSPRSTPAPTTPSRSPWGSATTSAKPSARRVARHRRSSRTCTSATPMGGRTTSTSLVEPGRPTGLDWRERAEIRRTYSTSAAVLKASEDKTFPGAIVASLASPWGQAVAAGDPALTYFGSYREVFARDLYETFTGLLAAGDTETAADTVRFLFEHQQLERRFVPAQQPDQRQARARLVRHPARRGRLPDPDGPHDRTHGCRLLHQRDPPGGRLPRRPRPRLRSRAMGGAERVVTVDDRRRDRRPHRRRRDRRAQRRHGQGRGSTAPRPTTTNVRSRAGRSPAPARSSAEPYFIRLSKNADPNSEFIYNLGNGGPDADQRAIIDAGFLELPRLGILPVDDPDVANSIGVVDAVIAATTASGDGFYRYGTITPGTEDGYGDCNVGDATDCTIQGKPWAGVCGAQAQNRGSGHLWPVLSAERGEHHVAEGDRASAAELLLGMSRTGSGVGLIPEQVWENADLPASPLGTAPECASIGFVNGEAAGSASPLTWSAASFVRLSRTIRDGEITEQPVDTVARYIDNTQGATTLDLTSPANGSLVTGTATVAGTTAPFATVDIDAVNIDIDGAAIVSTTVAGADGSFTVEAPGPTGSLDADGHRHRARRRHRVRTVHGDLRRGPRHPALRRGRPRRRRQRARNVRLSQLDAFVDGAYDLQAFEVYDSGPDTVTFRVQTRDLTPTFGSPLGAQLVDVYLRDPAATTTSTAASFPQRNYTIDPAAAWSRLIEVQGFGQRFIDAVRCHGRHGGDPRNPGHAMDHVHGEQGGAGRHARHRLVVRRGPHRPGRVQPRPGPRVPAAVARTSSSESARPRRSPPPTRSAPSTRPPSPRRWTSSRRTAPRRRTSSTRWTHRSSSRR